MASFVRTHIHNPTSADLTYRWDKGIDVKAGQTVVVDHDVVTAARRGSRKVLMDDLAAGRVQLGYEIVAGPGVVQVSAPEAMAAPAAPAAPAEPRNLFADVFKPGSIEQAKPPVKAIFGDTWEKKGINSPRRTDIPAVDIVGGMQAGTKR